MGKCLVCKIMTLLAGIGALNWGLLAFLHVNLVEKILGDMTLPARIVYGLVALSGLLLVISTVKPCCPCNKKG